MQFNLMASSLVVPLIRSYWHCAKGDLSLTFSRSTSSSLSLVYMQRILQWVSVMHGYRLYSPQQTVQAVMAGDRS